MEVKCDYCGGFFDDTLENCPHCGGVNNNIRIVSKGGPPKTINELKEWYVDKNLPPYTVTRFFIGINCKEARAFGIYEDNGVFIVYKNKDNGQRAVRYQGPDEAYAVNEIYLKLKEEIINQKARNSRSKQGDSSSGNRSNQVSSNSRRKRRNSAVVIIGIALCYMLITLSGAVRLGAGKGLSFVAVMAFSALTGILVFTLIGKALKKKRKGFVLYIAAIAYVLMFLLLFRVFIVRSTHPVTYRYDNTVYCYYAGDYYRYDDSDGYVFTSYDSLPVEFVNNKDSYSFDSENIEWSSDYDFTQSDYYATYSDSGSSSSYDSDYSWDSDSSWDSGGTDWGSDW